MLMRFYGTVRWSQNPHPHLSSRAICNRSHLLHGRQRRNGGLDILRAPAQDSLELLLGHFVRVCEVSHVLEDLGFDIGFPLRQGEESAQLCVLGGFTGFGRPSDKAMSEAEREVED